ncbi:hypothetical protein BJ322DRAFT_1078469 [Thelephora terrestris]|uniref:Uncharacterized protein n=1 Tax=Thelephora terrestris TaxID=56493 RepID=A0A9P6H9B6_9AGAM|nr:hypothetical protein BJ322DRAFT_1078469 [Thelephora terrestris]
MYEGRVCTSPIVLSCASLRVGRQGATALRSGSVHERSLAGKTVERREARRWDEEASFRDTECRYEPWERVGIHPGAYFGKGTAGNRDRIEPRSRLDIRDDDERLNLLHRLRWRTMRTSRLAAEESADNEPRLFEEREAENLLQESELFLA